MYQQLLQSVCRLKIPLYSDPPKVFFSSLSPTPSGNDVILMKAADAAESFSKCQSLYLVSHG